MPALFRGLRAALGRPGLASALAIVASLAIAAPALAHAELVESTPADGASVPPPREVVAVFSEAIVGDRSSLEVRDATGATVARGGLDPTDPEGITMRAELPTLEPGTYTVRWTAVADDGHVERGTFTFQVVPTPSPSPSAFPSATATPPPSPSAGPSASEIASPSSSSTAASSPPSPTASAAPTEPREDGTGASFGVVVPIAVALALVALGAGWLLRWRGG